MLSIAYVTSKMSQNAYNVIVLHIAGQIRNVGFYDGRILPIAEATQRIP